MVKPDAESGGKGVEKLRTADFPDVASLYAKLKQDNIGVVEEVITQHPQMDALNPHCLNTLRIVTILNDQGPHIVYGFVRIGNSDRPVDNLHSGGMFAPIDLETGKISAPGYDKERVTYPAPSPHRGRAGGLPDPLLGGVQGPVPQAATRVPQMRYIGWDVGVTPNALCSWRATICPATTSSRCRPTPRTRSACCLPSANT